MGRHKLPLPPPPLFLAVLPSGSQDVVDQSVAALFYYFAMFVSFNHLLRNAFQGMG